MTNIIHAIEKPLSKIFSDDFVFSIPAYQRPYAWTTEEARELLSDLLSPFEDSPKSITDLTPYFLGSIVLIKNESIPEADVVDGQQRLTTLTILLSVLRKLVIPAIASEITTFIYQRGLVIAGIEDRYRLQLREKDKDFFRQYIQHEDGLDILFKLDSSLLTDSQRNIQANALCFFEVLKEKKEQLNQFVMYLVTRCFLVVVSTPDVDSSYRVFSVLNSRGLDLSVSDILKSEIIGAINESTQQEKYTKIWEDEEVDLGRERFQELFSHIRMIYLKSKPKESVLKEIRKQILPLQKTSQNFIDNVLKPYSDALEIIKNEKYLASGKDAETVNSLLQWLNRIDNVDWIAPAILYLTQNYHDPVKLKRFFVDLERLTAGLLIRRADINERISRYGQLLTAIENREDLYALTSPLQLTSNESNQIIQTLDGDLYNNKRIRLYVLLRLDSALTMEGVKHDTKVISIEHVLPQNPKKGSTWFTWFPNDDERLNFVHRLGNLVLLSRRKNSEAQNFVFDKKRTEYFSNTRGSGIVTFALTNQVLIKNEWTPEVITQRQVDNLQILKKLWRL